MESFIAKAHQLNYSWYLFSIEQMFAPFTSLARSSYINALPEPSAQRQRTLKSEPQSCIWYYYLKKVTFGASTFDEPQTRPLFY